ncbi:MAG: hypothetical protein KAS32_00630 [Candidatus Peribacteraceae bacterium]|nr:hypothetical protein [Candidatus Peribacteraceae bacterium]
MAGIKWHKIETKSIAPDGKRYAMSIWIRSTERNKVFYFGFGMDAEKFVIPLVYELNPVCVHCQHTQSKCICPKSKFSDWKE